MPSEDDFHFNSSSSSEEEPLANSARPKPKPKPTAKPRAKPKPKAASLPKAAPSKAARFRTSMPDYSTWTVPLLQKEVGKFGFRSTVEKSVLVELATKCWVATHPAAETGPDGELELDKLKRKRAPAKPRVKKKNAEDDADDAREVEEEISVPERMRQAILADAVLYSRILRYEPVHFDEFVSLAALNSIKCSKPIIMKCLDEQCITFYTQDPTGGTRRRYK